MKLALTALLFLALTMSAIRARPGIRPADYPWRTNITTSIFWEPHPGFPQASAKKRAFNPFYVALPFNDLKFPELARRWLPAEWKGKPGDTNSRCEGRWIEIKNGAGRVCFAQWEDAGPICADDAAYVFGTRPPRHLLGLDVSPGIAGFFGIESRAQLSWRFVNDSDVKDGMWLHWQDPEIATRPRVAGVGTGPT